MEMNFEGPKMQKWNILTDPRVEVMKMSKNGSLFAFFAYDSKNYSLVWVKYLTPPKILYWVLSENGIVNGFWSYRSWDNEGREM